MAFIDQIGKIITNAGQETAAKAKNFADIAKLNSAIDDLQQQITRLYLDLGQAYYERHKDDEPFEEDAERMSAIQDAYAEIAWYEGQIDQIKGIEKCQNCGAAVPAGSVFCTVCGAKIARETISPKERKVCPWCHASVGEEDLFCMACGANLRDARNNSEV